MAIRFQAAIYADVGAAVCDAKAFNASPARTDSPRSLRIRVACNPPRAVPSRRGPSERPSERRDPDFSTFRPGRLGSLFQGEALAGACRRSGSDPTRRRGTPVVRDLAVEGDAITAAKDWDRRPASHRLRASNTRMIGPIANRLRQMGPRCDRPRHAVVLIRALQPPMSLVQAVRCNLFER